MDWEKKVQLVRLLNSEKYSEAVQYILSNIDTIDTQAIEMFILCYDFSQFELCYPLKDKVREWFSSYVGDLKVELRLGILNDLLN